MGLEMKSFRLISLMLLSLGLCVDGQADDAKHLFILSGQSNMAGLRPEESFTPAVEAAFGKDHVIVVKDAQGGQPIRRWYKKWMVRILKKHFHFQIVPMDPTGRPADPNVIDGEVLDSTSATEK